MNTRLAYIDQLKGFAMLLVVMGHVIGFCAHSHDDILTLIITTIQMPLFFMLNGLVISSIINGGGYLLKKFRQVMVPFFLWGILMSLYRDRSYTDYLSDYFCLGYWYLPVLFGFFIIYFFAYYINRLIDRNLITKRSKRIDILVSIILYVVLYFGLRFMTRFIPETMRVYIHYSQIIEYYPFFFIGALIKLYNLSYCLNKHSSKVITMMIIGLIPCFIMLHESQYNGFGDWYVLVFIRAYFCVVIYMMFMIGSATVKSNYWIGGKTLSMLGKIGRHTLAIYMIHYYMLKYIEIKHLFDFLYVENNLMALGAIILSISIVLCFLSIMIEKIISFSSWFSLGLLGRKNLVKA